MSEAEYWMMRGCVHTSHLLTGLLWKFCIAGKTTCKVLTLYRTRCFSHWSWKQHWGNIEWVNESASGSVSTDVVFIVNDIYIRGDTPTHDIHVNQSSLRKMNYQQQADSKNPQPWLAVKFCSKMKIYLNLGSWSSIGQSGCSMGIFELGRDSRCTGVKFHCSLPSWKNTRGAFGWKLYPRSLSNPPCTFEHPWLIQGSRLANIFYMTHSVSHCFML